MSGDASWGARRNSGVGGRGDYARPPREGGCNGHESPGRVRGRWDRGSRSRWLARVGWLKRLRRYKGGDRLLRQRGGRLQVGDRQL